MSNKKAAIRCGRIGAIVVFGSLLASVIMIWCGVVTMDHGWMFDSNVIYHDSNRGCYWKRRNGPCVQAIRLWTYGKATDEASDRQGWLDPASGVVLREQRAPRYTSGMAPVDWSVFSGTIQADGIVSFGWPLPGWITEWKSSPDQWREWIDEKEGLWVRVVWRRFYWTGLVLNMCLWGTAGLMSRMVYLDFRMRWRLRSGRCQACGYSLVGINNPCPECGTAQKRPHALKPVQAAGAVEVRD